MKKCSFHALPTERLSAFEINIDERYDDGEYQLIIKNPVDCPLRFFLRSEDADVNEIVNAISPILLEPKSDTSINIKDKGDLAGKINLAVKWGNPELPIHSTQIKSLPYPKGKSYKLLQGNNSNPTHNHAGSRYAFDFTLKIGDTITSTQDGYVIGVIDGYKGWGMSDKWKSFGNQIIIYDTVSHLFTMYGHFKQHGGLVEVGEYVKIGQPIALSGKTGQTTEEHLHFNVLQADSGTKGLKSYPLDSIGNYKVQELKRNQWMKN
jgi:murein DD-endopeptidase MepM/ murein hydrolase activator NlpD